MLETLKMPCRPALEGLLSYLLSVAQSQQKALKQRLLLPDLCPSTWQAPRQVRHLLWR